MVKKIILGIPVLLITIVINYLLISYISSPKIYKSINEIPSNNTALLLGTSKYMDDGSINLFFKYRCNTVYKLWAYNKINKIIISGDSTNKNYDEAQLMFDELVNRGIPDSIFILDKRGYSTIKSIRYCQSISVKKILIVSQKFHNERAILLAKKFNIEPKAFNAKTAYTDYGIRVWIREFPARIKLLLDLFIL